LNGEFILIKTDLTNVSAFSSDQTIKGSTKSGLMELELHVARFLKNSKMAFKSFKKIETTNLDIDNDEIY
jgi:hypothetical protein